MSDGGNKVGYRKPPVEHRFKPGTSGNPNGRPKRPKNNSEVLAALKNERIKMTINGKPRWVSPFEAAARRTLQICLAKGNPRDLRILFDMLKEEGFDWREEMREEAERGAESAMKKIHTYLERQCADEKLMQPEVNAKEDIECRTVMSCPTCGPAIAAIQAVHRADARLRNYPTLFATQMQRHKERQAISLSAE